MLCTTLSLVEKLSGKIRHKHVSELHVIIVEKLPNESPLQLLGVAGENTVTCYPHLHNCTGGREKNMGEVQTEEDRRAHAMSESPACWSSAGLSKEPPTDMCNHPHPHVSLSLTLCLSG